MSTTPLPAQERRNPRLIGHVVHTPTGPARLVDISNRQAVVRESDGSITVWPEAEVWS